MSYILKVQPMLDATKARQIETALTRRFANVARKFGRGLNNAMRFGITGGVIGASFAMFSNAILNPLREADQKINDILAKADNVGTRAKQFGSNEADYFALQSVAAFKGVQETDLINILTRMQTMIGNAALGEENALLNYKNEKNMVKVFLEVVKELNKLNDTEKSAIQAQIFGQKAVGKLAEFTDKDFDIETESRRLMREAGVTRENVQRRSEHLGALEDYQSRLREIRAARDYVRIGIEKKQVEEQNVAEENKNLRAANYMAMYEHLAKIDNALQLLQITMSEQLTGLLDKSKREQAVKAGIDLATRPQAMLEELKKTNREIASLAISLMGFMRSNPAAGSLESISKKITDVIMAINNKIGAR